MFTQSQIDFLKTLFHSLEGNGIGQDVVLGLSDEYDMYVTRKDVNDPEPQTILKLTHDGKIVWGTNNSFIDTIEGQEGVFLCGIKLDTGGGKIMTSSWVPLKFASRGIDRLFIDSDGNYIWKSSEGGVHKYENLNPSKKTCGIVTLSNGVASILTQVIKSESAIRLTAQEGGSYSGGIRVATKTNGVGFTIASSNTNDNCKFLWEVIEVV